MNNKILKALVAVLMAAVMVVLVLLIVNHVKMGLDTSNAKLVLALYVVMMGYALYRIFSNLKDVFKK